MKRIIVNTAVPVRLSDYLPGVFPMLGGSGKIFRLAKEKKIKLNGARCEGNTKLAQGDELCLYLPDELLRSPEGGPAFLAARPQLTVIYEDNQLLLVDKPAGLPVTDETEQLSDTLLNRALLYLYGRGEYNPNSGGFVPCLCHRLDTGTSGLLILAKTSKCESAVLAAIKKRAISKKYCCVTFGRPKKSEAILSGYLYKDAAKGIVHVLDNPRSGAVEIVTAYRQLAVSGRLSLLEVTLVTGRTHQIRVHLASIGCPILGDSKYGSNTANREFKTKYQLLCAMELTFPACNSGPLAAVSGKCFRTEKPWYFAQVLDGTLK
ncbi:MAG: RluA family pseudouridine synthase [Pygmaiobacter sp.]